MSTQQRKKRRPSCLLSREPAGRTGIMFRKKCQIFTLITLSHGSASEIILGIRTPTAGGCGEAAAFGAVLARELQPNVLAHGSPRPTRGGGAQLLKGGLFTTCTL